MACAVACRIFRRVAFAACGLVAVCVLGTAAPALSAASADDAGRLFFAAVRAHDYDTAYALLSPGVRRTVPYRDFVLRSRDIVSFRMVTLEAFDRGRNLVRYHVRGRLRVVYRGSLFDAVYAGDVGVSRDAQGWRIAQVDLEPVAQKRVGKAPPTYRL